MQGSRWHCPSAWLSEMISPDVHVNTCATICHIGCFLKLSWTSFWKLETGLVFHFQLLSQIKDWNDQRHFSLARGQFLPNSENLKKIQLAKLCWAKICSAFFWNWWHYKFPPNEALPTEFFQNFQNSTKIDPWPKKNWLLSAWDSKLIVECKNLKTI